MDKRIIGDSDTLIFDGLCVLPNIRFQHEGCLSSFINERGVMWYFFLNAR